MLRKFFKFFLLCFRSYQNLLILINSFFQFLVNFFVFFVQFWMIQFFFGLVLGYGIGGWRMGLFICFLLYWFYCFVCEILEVSVCLGFRSSQLRWQSVGKKDLCMILFLVCNVQGFLDSYRLYNIRYIFFKKQKLRIFFKFFLY